MGFMPATKDSVRISLGPAQIFERLVTIVRRALGAETVTPCMMSALDDDEVESGKEIFLKTRLLDRLYNYTTV